MTKTFIIMQNESEVEITTQNEEIDLDLDPVEEAPAPEPTQPVETPEAKLARLKRQTAQLEKKLGVAEEKSEPKSTGKLDETQLDYLDLKGISEAEDIQVLETVMKNTGKSLRDVLKDPYVVATLGDNQSQRNVRGAIPGSSKRSGIESNSVEFYVNRYKSTGQLPKDFETQSKVVDAITAESNDRRPRWER
jgi:hypothetical protein